MNTQSSTGNGLYLPENTTYRIVRHANAPLLSENPEEDDARVLSQKGLAQCAARKVRWEQGGVEFDTIIVSAKPRAGETAEAMTGKNRSSFPTARALFAAPNPDDDKAIEKVYYARGGTAPLTDYNRRGAGGSVERLAKNAIAVLRPMIGKATAHHRRVLIVAHAVTSAGIALFGAKHTREVQRFIKKIRHADCGEIVLTITPDGRTVVSYNDVVVE